MLILVELMDEDYQQYITQIFHRSIEIVKNILSQKQK